MAEEAVISELVSARLFPVTREITGKFAIFGFEIAQAAGIDLASVTDVVLTHMHMDHVGGLLADGVRGRLRQVSGHQRLAGRRQLPQKTDVGYWPLADMPRSRLV